MRENQMLFDAADRGDISTIKSLLAHGLSVNEIDSNNDTILIIAVRNKHKALVEELLKRNDIDLHIQSFLSGTALTLAIFNEETDTVLALLEKEKIFKSEDHPGAINWAIWRQRDRQVLEKFIQKEANFNTSGFDGLVDVPERIWRENDMTPLNCPFHPSYFPELKYTPLCFSLAKLDYDTAEYLLQHCQVDPNKSNSNGFLPLQAAVNNDNLQAATLLLKYGANPHLVQGKSILSEDVPLFIRNSYNYEMNPEIKKLLETAQEQYGKVTTTSTAAVSYMQLSRGITHFSSPSNTVNVDTANVKNTYAETIINLLKSNAELWKQLTADPDYWDSLQLIIKDAIQQSVLKQTLGTT